MDEREKNNLIIQNYFKTNKKIENCPYNEKNKIKINDDIYLTKKIYEDDNCETYIGIIKINNKNYKISCQFGYCSYSNYITNQLLLKLQGKNIHFPVYYGYNTCYYMNKDIREIKDISNLPLILQKLIIRNKSIEISDDMYFEVVLHSKLPLIFTNFRNGNINDFISKSKITEKQIFNFIAQIYLTMFFITKEIERIDIEDIGTTFVFEKIKKKTNFFYNLNNNKYYLPMSDYLFSIYKIETNKNANLNKNLKTITDYLLSLRILTPKIKLFLSNINNNRIITFDLILKLLVENKILLVDK